MAGHQGDAIVDCIFLGSYEVFTNKQYEVELVLKFARVVGEKPRPRELGTESKK